MNPATTAMLMPPPSPVGSDLPMLTLVSPPLEVFELDLLEKAGDAPVGEPQKLMLTDELKAEISRENERLETAEPQEILWWAAERFGSRFTMATAFGPEGMVLIHMLAEVAPKTPIFNLETGYQFKETLELREEIKR